MTRGGHRRGLEARTMGTGGQVTRYVLVAVALCLPVALFAAPAPGARARVTLIEKERVVGTIRALPPQAILLAVEPDSVERTIPYESIAKLEIQNGTKSRAGRYALIGGVIAAVPGALFGHELAQDLEINPTEEFYMTAGGALAFGIVGAGIGALIGSGTKDPRWEQVSF